MARVSSPEEQIVAVLHDVVEDTDWTFEDLAKEGFPPKLLDALKCVTRQEEESYDQFVKRSSNNPIACRVKLADLEDNMDVRRMPKVGDEERERLQKYLSAWSRLKSGKPD